MADQTDPPPRHDHPPVGSVAEEAARLLDALGGWVSTSGYAAGPAARSAADRPAAEPDTTEPDTTEPDTTQPDTTTSDHTDTDPAPPDPTATGSRDADGSPGETAPHGSGHCDHCGAANGTGQAVTCQWCPVCQGIGLLRSVRPETVDRLADLAGALAVALRDVATHSRGAAVPDPPPQHHGARGPRVHDITIEDEDQGSATR